MSEVEVSEQNAEGPVPAGGRVRIGLALGPGRATTVELPGRSRAPGAVRSRDVGLPADDGTWPALTAFLREVREDAGARRGELHLAVLRPLGHLKRLRLPPLRPEPLRRMVALGAERFFPAAGGGMLTGVARVPAGGGGAGAHILAAAAGTRLVEAAVGAAAEAGYAAGNVTAGPAAALAGALARLPALRRGRVALALRGEAGMELLCLERGSTLALRSAPLPAGAAPEEPAERTRALLAEVRERCGYVPGRVVLAGEGLCAEADLDGVEAAAVPELTGYSLEVLAAMGAAFPAADTPLLVREAQRAATRRRQRRRTVMLCALSAVCLAGAGTAHLAQLRREVEGVRDRRERIRPAVAEALRMRGEIQAVRARVDALAALERGRPGWVELFATVSAVLPRDAHLTSLAVAGEELRLDGQARSATALVPVFEAAPWVSSVRLGSPVRREQTPAGARERFTLTLGMGSGGEPRPTPGGAR
ncbi:MAG: PilN domain-containing protein [Longimicrobiaceae bacterium]